MFQKLQNDEYVSSVDDITVRVVDGEICYAIERGKTEISIHNLLGEEKRVNWIFVEQVLESVYRKCNNDFYDILHVLRMDSRSYMIIRRVIRRKLNYYESRIAEIHRNISL